MKRDPRKAIVFIVLILGILEGLSAERTDYKNSFGADLLRIATNTYTLKYEIALLEQFSAGVHVSYSPNYDWVTELGMIDLLLHGRFYPEKKGTQGLYLDFGLGGQVVFRDYSETSYGIEYKYTFSGFLPKVYGALGYKWVFGPNDRFFIAPVAGYHYLFGKIQVSYQVDGEARVYPGFPPDLGGLLAGITTGFRF